MAKIIVLSLLLFFLIRFIKRLLIAPAKLAEEMRRGQEIQFKKKKKIFQTKLKLSSKLFYFHR